MINEKEIEKLLKLIATGKAILFTGAGFSIKSKNINNEYIPLGQQLSEKICKEILNEEICNETNDLAEITELARYEDEHKLVNLLNKTFTVKEIHSDNETIVNLPWRRIYTTNYDDVIEEAGKKAGKIIYPATPSDSPEIITKENNICFHINGYVKKLTNEVLDNEFKLTSSSYMKQDPLYETRWGDVFKRDIEFASAIVFVGYSLSDYNIKKLIFEAKEKYKDKIYFILNKQERTIDKFTFKQYGKLIEIGNEGFAEFIKKNKNIINSYKNIMKDEFESFQKLVLEENLMEIRHDEIRDFLVYGKYNSNYIYAGLTRNYKNFIFFDWVKRLKEDLLDISKGFYHINGDLGSGKSIGLEILAYELVKSGEVVLCLRNKYGDFIEDLTKMQNIGTKVYLIIDNAEENLNVLKYIYNIFSKTSSFNLVVISSGRKYIGSYDEIFNKAENISISEFLNENERDELIKIIRNIGAERDIKLKQLISKHYDNSLPNFLLDFMNSEFVAQQIKKEFDKLIDLDNGKYKKTIISLCLVGMFQKEIEFSVIKILTKQDYIRESEFLNNDSFKNFFKDESGHLKIKSSIFARYVLKNLFLDNLKKEALLEFIKIADEKKFEKNTNDKVLSLFFEEIFKELIKYYSLSKVFKNNETILSYFEQVKNELSWLENDPNYWIQLALLNLERKKINIAYDMIETAYSKAKKKDKYEYDYIDTVKARYNIEKALNEKSMNVDEVFQLFLEADDLLRRVKASDNKYRQINKYIYIFNSLKQKNFFNHKNIEKKIFINKIKSQLTTIEKVIDNHYEGINKIYLLNLSKTNLEKIISELENE